MSGDRLRLNAYVLAADPSWIEESVASYYHLVERIVVSYDETATSWTGVPISSEECLARLRAVDVESKMEFLPGRYYRPDFHPLENDTYQRQAAVDAASVGADWVLQLDTDEVLGDPDEFLLSLQAAHERGFTGLEYPSRILYQHVRGRLYLEQCTRLWSVSAHYPGPMAVAAGSTLDALSPGRRPALPGRLQRQEHRSCTSLGRTCPPRRSPRAGNHSLQLGAERERDAREVAVHGARLRLRLGRCRASVAIARAAPSAHGRRDPCSAVATIVDSSDWPQSPELPTRTHGSAMGFQADHGNRRLVTP